jgi:hypothetical protein
MRLTAAVEVVKKEKLQHVAVLGSFDKSGFRLEIYFMSEI